MAAKFLFFKCTHFEDVWQVFGMPTILGEEVLFNSFRVHNARGRSGRSVHMSRSAEGLAIEKDFHMQAADVRGDGQNRLLQHQSIGGICTKITDCKFDLVGVCSN